MAGRLDGLDIHETSGVDHPATLEEGWLLMKSADNGLTREVEELLKAATKTCPSCGATVPSADSYCPDCGAGMKKSTESVQARVSRLQALYKALGDVVTKRGTSKSEGGEMSNELPDIVREFLEKAEAPEEVLKAIESIGAKTEPAGTEDELLKGVPEAVRTLLETERSQREELQKSVETMVAEKETAEAIAKARGWAHVGLDPQDFGATLQKLRKLDPEVAAGVEKVLDGAETLASNSALFSSIGKSLPATSGAENRLDALAKDHMSKASDTDYASAYSKVLETEEGAKLYAESLREKEAKA
jgi:rubrerythrin